MPQINDDVSRYRALKAICRALDVPYQPMMYMYDKAFTDEQINNNMPDHISYNKILAVNSINSFIECPVDLPNAALAIKIPDNSMMPRLEKDTYAFVEFNTPLENKDIGLFEFNKKIIIRRYVIRKDSLVLRADNKDFSDIIISEKDNYYIIGRIVGTSTGLLF